MLDYVDFDRTSYTELSMYQCGMEDCVPGHFYGPALRDHFLIHYILKGKGIFKVGEMVYNLEKGHGFLIYPNIITFYQADFDDPWHYCWVGFQGLRAELYLKHANLTSENPIFRYDKDDYIKDCFMQMLSTKKLVKSREIRLLAILYLFLSQLIETNGEKKLYDKNEDRKEVYIKKAIEYIEMNYSRNISIAEISNYIGLDRSYFCSIFKDCLRLPPQIFLINYRINKACELMRNKMLSIGDVSRSVGYDDPLQFSKMFKKVRCSSPIEYRKHLMGITGDSS